MKKLVEKAMAGNKEAFAEIIEILKIDLYKIAKVRLKNEDDVLDVIQETIISAYKSIQTLNAPENFKKWIIKILINKCNDNYYQKKNYMIPFEEISESFFADEKRYEDLEIEDILKHLNEDEKLIITLYYLEDYKSKEIAWILDMNENTVKTKINRSRTKLKDKLEKGGFYNG